VYGAAARSAGEKTVSTPNVSPSSDLPRLRFDGFELVGASELRRAGARVPLPPQPLRLLAALAGRPGEIVGRGLWLLGVRNRTGPHDVPGLAVVAGPVAPRTAPRVLVGPMGGVSAQARLTRLADGQVGGDGRP
jgi:hypothetical protein